MALIDTTDLATYDEEYVQPHMNDYSVKKLTGTVSGSALTFTNSASIASTDAIDGPYIADVLIGVSEVSVSGTTITFTLTSEDANGKAAYCWLRTPS